MVLGRNKNLEKKKKKIIYLNFKLYAENSLQILPPGFLKAKK
jgi:hypothetical protein